MKLEDFDRVVKRFRERPISGRKLYLYCGNKGSIKSVLPIEILKEVDLLKIIPAEDYADDTSIQKAIKDALKKILQENIQSLTGQQVLLIINSWILARYDVRLSIFYQYYLVDRTMVILHIDKTSFGVSLPKYVIFKDNIVLKYFEKLLPEENKDNILKE